jgi:hypothetical protein
MQRRAFLRIGSAAAIGAVIRLPIATRPDAVGREKYYAQALSRGFLSVEDVRLLEEREFFIEQICRLFQVPRRLVGI